MKTYVLGFAAAGLLAVSTSFGAPIEIDQVGAIAGGAFPGDQPGFPVTLNRSGSYVLTSNLRVPDADTTAIQVNASYVTIDMNGFEISGPTICNSSPVTCSPTGSGRGIDASNVLGLTVRNGSITGVGLVGLSAPNGLNRIEGVTVRWAGLYGIRIGQGIVTDCMVFQTGDIGIVAGGLAVISRNTVSAAGGHGIYAGPGSRIEGNVIRASFENGIATVPFNGDVPGLIRGNVLWSNLGFGLELDPMGGYSENVLYGNVRGTIKGGVSMGTNVCDGSTTCP